jgi:hypothetical protein
MLQPTWYRSSFSVARRSRDGSGPTAWLAIFEKKSVDSVQSHGSFSTFTRSLAVVQMGLPACGMPRPPLFPSAALCGDAVGTFCCNFFHCSMGCPYRPRRSVARHCPRVAAAESVVGLLVELHAVQLKQDDDRRVVCIGADVPACCGCIVSALRACACVVIGGPRVVGELNRSRQTWYISRHDLCYVRLSNRT